MLLKRGEDAVAVGLGVYGQLQAKRAVFSRPAGVRIGEFIIGRSDKIGDEIADGSLVGADDLINPGAGILYQWFSVQEIHRDVWRFRKSRAATGPTCALPADDCDDCLSPLRTIPAVALLIAALPGQFGVR